MEEKEKLIKQLEKEIEYTESIQVSKSFILGMKHALQVVKHGKINA